MRRLQDVFRAGVFAAVGLASVLAATGCESVIDPDTLVRELRVLSIRTGDPAPASATELQAEVRPVGAALDLVFTVPQIGLGTLVVAPTGPGRRVAAPRPLAYDWFLCIGTRSLYVPGTLDAECRKFGPLRDADDPDPMQNKSLVYLGAGDAEGSLSLPTDRIKVIIGELLQRTLTAGGTGGTGGTGGMGMLPTRPITLLLPVLLRASVAGSDLSDPLSSEVGYTFLRVVVALPGMTLPPPNRNPVLDRVEGGGREPVRSDDGTTESFATLPMCTLRDDGSPCVSFRVSKVQSAWLMAHSTPESIERYTPIDDSGRTDVAETMRYAWFSTDGTFGQPRTGDKFPETEWKDGDERPAPPEVKQVPIWVIAQDERGGADYRRYMIEFMP